MTKKNIVVLTGAGMSAESGISTFRDANGLWENHDIMEVASPIGWEKNKKLVLEFYNQRRRQLKDVQPNAGHFALAEFETKYNVTIITQNVDNLHERAGSKNILHLHGELTKARSISYPDLVYDIGYRDINPGDKCEKGSQLRPHIVWFGEAVPLMDEAAQISSTAEILIIVGTSMIVYPAASLIDYVPDSALKYIIDPVKPSVYNTYKNLVFIEQKASIGTPELVKEILKRKEM